MARTKEFRAKAPKIEFYRSVNGRRPVYYWKQDKNDFYHAGYEMPPILCKLMDQQSDELNLEGDKRFNHCIIICNDQDDLYAPPHFDKHATSLFVDFSLGYPRIMEFTRNVHEKNCCRKNADGHGTI